MGSQPRYVCSCERILTPRISLNELIRWTEDQGDNDRPEQLEDLVNWQVVLSSDYVHSRLRDLSESRRWAAALPGLLDDFSMLLRDAMEPDARTR